MKLGKYLHHIKSIDRFDMSAHPLFAYIFTIFMETTNTNIYLTIFRELNKHETW